MDIAQNNADKIFGQLRSLATAITSIAVNEDDGNMFPNVTVPHFDLRTQEIADLTGMEMITFIPFVELANRSGWEVYATENKDWILEDYVRTCRTTWSINLEMNLFANHISRSNHCSGLSWMGSLQCGHWGISNPNLRM